MRTRATAILTTLLAGLLVSGALEPAHAQFFDKLKDAAEDAAERELTDKVREGIEGFFQCVWDDLECIRGARERGEDVALTDEDGNVITDSDGDPVSDPEAAEAVMQRPGEGVWTNYDFVPGDEVLFFEDYSDDKVGDFPRRMEFVQGNWEIVEWRGRNLLRNTGPRHAALKIELPRELPERFTIELDAYVTHGNQRFILATHAPERARQNWGHLDGNMFQIGARRTGVTRRAEGVESLGGSSEVGESLTPIRILVDGSYAKVFVRERRVANVPNAALPRSSTLYLENVYNASAENPMYVGSIRVAEGGTDLYERLSAEGRVATRGILFDVDSDRIRPESTPTLQEIGAMLREHADLRLAIEGHTDATGEEEYNQELSERRARAVVDFLVAEYGLDAGRLEARGFGESRPVADNDTPEGRQNNRRVELVQIGGRGDAAPQPRADAPSPDRTDPASPEAGQGSGLSREGRVGTITATIDGERRTFPVIGLVTGEHTIWGSGWNQNGPRVGMTLWGVTGSLAEAGNRDDHLAIGLSFRMPETSTSFAALSRECDPFGDRVTYSVDGYTKTMVAERCGGIEVESFRYDEAADAFVVKGTFAGEMDDLGWVVRDGRFEATLPRFER